jgi:Phage tail lysozyme
MATTEPGPEYIWEELLRGGSSAVEAAGLMGNGISESGLDPEVINPGGPEDGVGLWQWQTTDYPDVPMPTGNRAKDIRDQVAFLIRTGGLRAASGTTVSETAGNFAANYERCDGCQPGGAQYNARVAQAATVAGWASSGSWPTKSGQATTTATLTAAEQAEQDKGQASCAWSVGWGGVPDTSWLHRIWSFGTQSGNVSAGEICLLSKSQARAMLGVGLVAAGGYIMLQGVAVMVALAGLQAVSSIRGFQGTTSAAAGTVRGLGSSARWLGTSP